MHRCLLHAVWALGLALLANSGWAEKADRNKPMNIEADNLRYDDLKQVSVFTGRVVLTKGTIVIRGAQLEVRQDPEGYQFGWVTGSSDKRAFFRQKREALDEFMEGEGESIYYDGKADVVTFTKKAEMRRYRGTTLADQVTGAVIVYDNVGETFRVDGNATAGAATNKNTAVGLSSGSSSPSGRVRAMLTPKPEASAPASAPQPPAVLRPAPALPGVPN